MKTLIIWLCNGVVALFCVLAIAGYFFAPVWRIVVKAELQADDFKTIVDSLSENDQSIKDLFGEDPDFKEILGAEQLEIPLSISVRTGHLLSSFGSDSEAIINELIGNNVDSLVDQVSEILMKVVPAAAKSVAKNVVKDEINSNVKKHLDSLTEGSDVSVEEVKDKLAQADITDEYIDQKVEELVDSLFQEDGTNKEAVTEQVMSVVDEVYDKLKASDDPDFKDIEISEEDKDAIRENIGEVLDEIADEDGEIDVDSLLDKLLSGLLGGNGGEGKADGIAPLAAQSSPEKDSGQLKEQLRAKIMEKLNDENVRNAIVWGLRGLCLFLLLTWIPWIYIIVKIIVKLATGSDEPTVRLKAPIICGWLPFLLLFIAPSIAIVFAKDPLTGLLANTLPEGFAGIVEGLRFSFFTSGWIAFLSAIICLGISIFYIVARKSNKRSERETVTETSEVETETEEIAVSEETDGNEKDE